MEAVVLKFVPVIVTEVPIAPDEGEKEVIVGTGTINVNPVRLPVPNGVVTETDPDDPLPTVAIMAVGEI